ncbi:MAG: hypothetical protein FWC23_02655, partial [Chitinispirillia bacterium]|nr:hypothetical protein [Chitinispirillia bacterium]MCL2268077.1 hypothetical protein [Chitinispirillia bacterium]
MKRQTLFFIALLCTATLAQDAQDSKPVYSTAEFRSELVAVNFEPDGTKLTPQSSAALDSVAAEQGKQAVAIYMAGDEPQGAQGVHNIMGGELARVISGSDRYLAVDRTEVILDQLAKEHTYQRSGAVDDD